MDKRTELLDFISHRNTDKTIFSPVTPAGTLMHNAVERFGDGLTGLGDWINSAESFDIVEWISNDILSGNRDKAIGEHYRAFAAKTKPYGISEIKLKGNL